MIDPPASESSGELRKIIRLAVFSGVASVCDVHIWAQ